MTEISGLSANKYKNMKIIKGENYLVKKPFSGYFSAVIISDEKRGFLFKYYLAKWSCVDIDLGVSNTWEKIGKIYQWQIIGLCK